MLKWYVNSALTVDICTATVIRELCNKRGTCNISDVHNRLGTL